MTDLYPVITPKNKFIKRLKALTDPSEFLVDFNKVVIPSTLYNEDSQVQMQNIVDAFNLGRKTIMTESVIGTRFNPDKFRLVALNKQPELVKPSNKQYRLKYFPNIKDKPENLGYFEQTKLFYGAYGSYVINVPVGKIALGMKGNVPILLGPGPHVIHDQNMREIKDENLVPIDQIYITHGNYHIIRVQPGFVAMIYINNTPYFLTPEKNPYVFEQAIFAFNRKNNMVSLNTPYIRHGNYHILQLPKGNVATIWKGPIPEILEAADEPIIFNDATFRLETKISEGKEILYHDATDEKIIHGSIKRLMPRTGTVLVSYNGGELTVHPPSNDNKPILITNPNHLVYDKSVPTNIQTIEFPSKKTREARKKEGDAENINYEIFRTSDGLPIGVKLLVVYEIDDPVATLKKLNPDQIVPHIENLVVADMGMVIQSATSSDFLQTNKSQASQIKQPPQTQDLITDVQSSSSVFYQHLQDRVKDQLCEDFSKYGIKLVRLNIETPKILDSRISEKMAEFSLKNTKTRVDEALLPKEFNIAQTKAKQDATVAHITQQQNNENSVTAAKAKQEASILEANGKLEADKLTAEGNLAKTKAEAEGKQMLNDAEIRKQQMLTDIEINKQKMLIDIEINKQKLLLELSKQRAEMYEKNDKLFKYETRQLETDSFSKINTMIVSPDTANSLYGIFPAMNIQKNLFEKVK